ncbi:hypothetical protein [Pseudonocardia sp. GCM10023141]|uniref:hypothetical protein n=1 Tax=Pseudonocardia sp. GCM10023141 TaxID=3252653 RepID=UPI00361AB208
MLPNSERLQIRAAEPFDPVSVYVANTIIDSAVAAGHPDDAAVAAATLRGPGAAAAIQSALHRADGPVDHVHALDIAALEFATSAVTHAADAYRDAATREALPRETVNMLDGAGLTRGQVAGGLHDRQRAAARNEERGNFEHRESPPVLLMRVLCAVTLSTIDFFLLLVPVTNASLSEPLSIAYVLGLLGLLILMNDTLPLMTGHAFRNHREQLHAVWDNVGPSAVKVQRKDADRGRTAAGQADLRRLRATALNRTIWSAALTVVVLVYGSLIFTRVLNLATRLGTATPLTAGLAAGLVTACTVAAPLFLTWRWSRGNRLGDQVREFGALTAESSALAEQLAQTAVDAVVEAELAIGNARSMIVIADEDGARAMSAVNVGLQLASDRLGQPDVVVPASANVFPISREARDHAEVLLERAQRQIVEIDAMLKVDPFPANGAAPDPWSGRHCTRPGRAVPVPRM